MGYKLCLVLAVLALSYVRNGGASPSTTRDSEHSLTKKSEEIHPYLEPEDTKLTVPQIIAKYGYPVEVHEIITADGYILQAHRIPYGKQSGPAPNKPPIWLQHGILGDSSNFIMNNEDEALAYILANQGYDVWIGNGRGNTYSRKHVSLNPNDGEFWNFSWHEMGVYDITAAIDYVLAENGADKLFYIGHSMGTTMFWTAMSERPEYNSKIRLMSALAPVGFTEHMISPISLLAPLANSLEDILQFLGAYEFLPMSPVMDFLGATLCRENSPLQGLCSNVLFLVAGFNSDLFNKTSLPIIMGHSPAGASTRSVVHFAQGINSGLFRKFNHGKAKNRELYGQDTPPEYPLENITCPVALYWAENDWLGSPKDVYRLAETLPNLVKKYRLNFDKYNHLDFIFAINNNHYLNNGLVDFLKHF